MNASTTSNAFAKNIPAVNLGSRSYISEDSYTGDHNNTYNSNNNNGGNNMGPKKNIEKLDTPKKVSSLFGVGVGKFNQSIAINDDDDNDNVSIGSHDSYQGSIPTATRKMRKLQNTLSNSLSQYSIRTANDSISYYNETPYEKHRSPTKEVRGTVKELEANLDPLALNISTGYHAAFGDTYQINPNIDEEENISDDDDDDIDGDGKDTFKFDDEMYGTEYDEKKLIKKKNRHRIRAEKLIDIGIFFYILISISY